MEQAPRHPAARALPIIGSNTALSLNRLASTLSHIPFLAKATPEQLESLLGSSFLRRYHAGDKIITQGEYGHSLFVLVEGAVRIEATADNGQRLKLARLDRAAQYFGELAILGRTRRSADAIADGDAALVEIEKTKLEKLDKELGDVLSAIEQQSQRRAINTFLSQHRAFSQLDEQQLGALVQSASLSVHQRGTAIFDNGDLADQVLIIKSGVAKLQQEEQGAISVLAYFNTGDVVGLWDGLRRAGKLVSMGYVEVIKTLRVDFERLRDVRPGFFDQFHKAEALRSQRSSDLKKKATNPPIDGNARINETGTGAATVFGFVEELVLEGAQEAQSLLTIDLNLCVRCGNCVSACESRHGAARMTRRGKKLVRREDIEVQGRYQTILLPSSCRHCVNPECMIGCPTGAIHRIATGEVDIHDFCIGCGNCATRCPWDNIQMVPSPGRLVNGEEMKLMATKCNLCAGYEDSNCVSNCPTGAILRIEPNTYFEEVAQLLGTGTQKAVGGGRTETKEKLDLTRVVFPAIAGFFALAMIVFYATAEDPFVTYSTRGIALGVAALVWMFGAAALGARRKLARFKIQLGPFLAWTRAHVYLGGLVIIAVLLHSGFRLGGVVTSMLLLLTVLDVATGLFGVSFYRWLPKVITRIERDSQVEEDLLEEQRTLRRRREEILRDTIDEVRAAARRASSKLGSRFSRYAASYDRARAEAELLERVKQDLNTLTPDRAHELERLISDMLRQKEISAALLLYRVRRGWLATHIAVTATLLTLVAVHVASVLYY